MEDFKVKSNPSSEDTQSCEWADTRTFQSSKTARSSSTKQSLIFASQKFNKRKTERPLNDAITIYYFDLPVHKNIKFERNSTIADLIYEAIDAYLGDNSFDHSKMREKHHSSKDYVTLRLRA
jgi:hypothetical protein